MFTRTVLVRARCLAVALFVATMVGPAVADKKAKVDKATPVSATAVDKALRQLVSLEFSNTPLNKLADHLQQTLGVPVLLDQKALEEVGIAVDAPVTHKVADITAQSALSLILRNLDLVAVPRDGLLLITTPDKEAEHLTVQVYDVSDVMGEDVPKILVRDWLGRFSSGRRHQPQEEPKPEEPKTQGADDKGTPRHPGTNMFNQMGKSAGASESSKATPGLIDAVLTTVDPTTWDQVGGPGSLTALALGKNKTFVVRQTHSTHEKIAKLLAALREIKKEPARRSLGAVDQAQREAEATIGEKLRRPITVEFVDKPLSEVAAWFQKELGVPVQLDYKALEEVGIALNVPVTFKLQGLPAHTALERILEPHDLAWAVQSEVLLVTTPDRVAESLSVRVYNVDDLCKWLSKSGRPTEGCDALMETIRSSIATTSWDQVGGPGSLVACPASSPIVLISAQTGSVHEEIESLLARLRETGEKQGGAEKGR